MVIILHKQGYSNLQGCTWNENSCVRVLPGRLIKSSFNWLETYCINSVALIFSSTVASCCCELLQLSRSSFRVHVCRRAMRPGMDGYDHDVEARSADIVQDKRNEQVRRSDLCSSCCMREAA